MSQTCQIERPALSGNSLLAGDSFRLSMVLLISVTVGQRILGLVRNVLFCGLLADHELGRWSIASTFLGWAAPFVVLGLPGSFGRLSEHYRQRAQLIPFLRRTGTMCGVLIASAIVLHLAFPDAIAALVFNDPRQASLIPLLGIALAAVVTMNFFAEFLTSVRLTRAVSLMHLTNSLIFTVLGVSLLMCDRAPESSLIIAFGSSTACAALIGAIYTFRFSRLLPRSPVREESTNLWRRVAPLALWIWCGNTISNAFDLSDQYVLKHLVDLPQGTVDAMIGQLFASRFVPMLIVSVAVMVAGSLLPYLIKDGENGQHDAAQRRMNSVIRFAAIGFTLVAASTQLFSPLLFTWLLQGKYDSGLHLMPLAFIQYTWFSLSLIGNQYLIASDRPRIALIPPMLGLLVSVALTSLTATTFGLAGVAWSTMAANGVELICLFALTAAAGMKWNRSVIVAVALPFSLALGGAAALAVIAVLFVTSARGNWFLTSDERDVTWTAVRQYWAKLTRSPRRADDF